MDKVAFIGLGVMGRHMARRLIAAGHEVTVFNRTASRAESFVRDVGGQLAATPAAAARGANVVLICVGNDDHLRQVVEGSNGVLGALGHGAVLVDHSTDSASLARELAREVARRRAGFLDAPVSGGEQGAANGTLTIMAGGQREHFDRVQSVFKAYSRSAQLLGPAGSGQLAKMVNQICIAGVLQGLAEGLHFAESAGLDPSEVVKVISQGAAQSWQMDHRHAAMIEGRFDFGFAVDWMRKDLSLALDEARRNGARLPLTALVDQFYSDLQAAGGGRWDTSSLIARFRPMVGTR